MVSATSKVLLANAKRGKGNGETNRDQHICSFILCYRHTRSTRLRTISASSPLSNVRRGNSCTNIDQLRTRANHHPYERLPPRTSEHGDSKRSSRQKQIQPPATHQGSPASLSSPHDNASGVECSLDLLHRDFSAVEDTGCERCVNVRAAEHVHKVLGRPRPCRW